MATRKRVARSKTKPGNGEQPIPFTPIHRAAERAGITPAKAPNPKQDTVLADALEIVGLVEHIFYTNGVHSSDPEDILHEALSSLEQDLAGFGARLESSDVDIAWPPNEALVLAPTTVQEETVP